MNAEAIGTCPHCTRDLPESAFALRKLGGTARDACCRDCINDTRREARDRAKGAHRG